ncbi:MAG: PIN domain-containing protein [Prevotella sp.]|jgi:predicted nucleic acid-binding protein|nr:PIN domain-containing protein [Prevotella sp.]
MKVFLDTNIIIDFIARRENFYQAAANLINLGVKGEVELYTTPLTYATCVFITRKILGYEGAIKAIQILDNYLNVTPMDSSQCRNALFSTMPDFEDMLQFESAFAAGCDVIVTRNKKHFPQEVIQILDSTEFFDCYWYEEG